MENLTDAYQVMKFAGEEIDSLDLSTESARYWDLNNLWWDAATIYVPKMKELNDLTKKSH